jgi:hypothetical protein
VRIVRSDGAGTDAGPADPTGPEVIVDADGHAARAYGIDPAAAGMTLILVRPDGHVGLAVDGPSVDRVLAYLKPLTGGR